MKTLKQMADELAGLSGEMVNYFINKEQYDSKRIYKFLACCEEVGYAIKDEDYESAARIIEVYLCFSKCGECSKGEN